jgi:hypothetical protein
LRADIVEAELLSAAAAPEQMESSTEEAELSIVVAADEAGRGLRSCLDALRPQVRSSPFEVIVADGSQCGWIAGADSGWVRVLRLAKGTGVPHLWSAGMDAARGRIIALTIEQCVPASDWAQSILRAHATEYAAVGGAIAARPELRLAEWAVYFSRYSRFLLPATPELLEDLAGDNCSYKRAALAGLSEEMAGGFWETFVHRAMRGRGQQLMFDPTVIVTFAGPMPYGMFLRRRFSHARVFAARSGRTMTSGARLARAIASPLVPFVMWRRIAGRVWKRLGHRGKFLTCSPLLFALLVSWAMGEGIGYVFEAVGSTRYENEPGRRGGTG